MRPVGMAKKKRTRPPQPNPKPAVRANAEVDRLIVAWMLAVMTAFACNLVGGLLWVWQAFATTGPALAALFAVALFAAAAIGVMELAALPVVLRRQQAPPRPIVAFAILVGLLPWLGMLAMLVGGGD